jgi:CubicO group peptidase (beta-lactamase class C family)
MGQHELQQPAPVLPQRTSSRISGRILLKWAASAALLLTLSASFNPQDLESSVLWLAEVSTSNWEIKFGSGKSCQAPAPNLFAYSPPRPSNDLVAMASKDVDKYLSNRASKPDVDSIAISIVTAAGPLFEAGYGVLKANETDTDMEETHPVDRDSIYRIASISKMFTVLETLILRERGALNWYSNS